MLEEFDKIFYFTLSEISGLRGLTSLSTTITYL